MTPNYEELIVERRKHTKLRSIYPDACVRIAHFFSVEGEWGEGPADYLAQLTLHENYPDLSGAEVRILANAIRKYVS